MTYTSVFPYTDEFKPVSTSRKKRKQKGTPPSVHSLVHSLREQLGEGEWFTQCSKSLKIAWDASAAAHRTDMADVQVLCLGLGSPTSSLNARAQLAFLMETCKFLNVAKSSISIYDPVFTEEDVSLLEELQLKVLGPEDSRSSDYTIQNPTICFMPHCDLELYEALLKDNRSEEQYIERLFLVGNSLGAYLDSGHLMIVQKLSTWDPPFLHPFQQANSRIKGKRTKRFALCTAINGRAIAIIKRLADGFQQHFDTVCSAKER